MFSVLETLFPKDDFTLLAFILGMPLLGAFVNGIWGRRLGKPAVRLMALAAVGASFLACALAFVLLDHAAGAAGGEGAGGHAEHVRLSWTAWEWMHTTGGHAGTNIDVPIALRFSIDALSGVMMLIVTGVGFLIHLYATSYMEKDAGFWRFFCYLNLFIFSMLVLILGDNLPVLFIGWEGVGLCSYLLIGFWYDVLPNAAAGKKAFIANRIGDFGLICAMFLLVYYCGALDWNGLENNSQVLADNASSAFRIHLWPIGGGQYQGVFHFLQPKHPITISAATAVGLALFLGCTGKSAQIPLYVWLPDAMAGPTPVSALIHAATMVTAGVYLVCRMSFVFALSPFVMTTIAVVGALTALLAASIALVQNDIKKVLAYSTVSQLGYMFIGVGVGAFTAGFFHVLTHAFFKACLFLGAGSVIHAMHVRIHDDVKAQDMRYMGGLKRYMPWTHWTFFAATLAIAGTPLFSGFFSKDDILAAAYVNETVSMPSVARRLAAHHLAQWHQPTWIGPTIYAIGVVTAAMTAFYMFRAFYLTFHGNFRGWTIGRPSLLDKQELEAAAHGHAHDGDSEHEFSHEEGHHHEEDLKTPGRPPHESPRAMTIPLIVLATLAVFGGILNPTAFHVVSKGFHFAPLEHWLEPVFGGATDAFVQRPGAEKIEIFLMLGGIAAWGIGWAGARWVYVVQEGKPAKNLAESWPVAYRLMLDKWRIDELYEATVLAAVDALAETAAAFDTWFVDGIIAKLTSLVVAALGTVLRTVQNGVVHVYAAVMVAGIAVLAWFFVTPHADVTVDEQPSGDFVVTAGPGMGYRYRWDADGNGTWDDTLRCQPGQTCGDGECTGEPADVAQTAPGQKPPESPSCPNAWVNDKTTVKVHLEAGKSQVVRFATKNAFGLTGTKEVTLTRPAPLQTLEVGQLGQNGAVN